MNWKEIKITRRKCLDRWSNSYCTGSEWLIHGRALNADGTHYLPFKFVILIDAECDLYDPETGEDIPEAEAIDELIFSYTDMFYGISAAEIVEICNETIEKHNRRVNPRRTA